MDAGQMPDGCRGGCPRGCGADSGADAIRPYGREAIFYVSTGVSSEGEEEAEICSRTVFIISRLRIS